MLNPDVIYCIYKTITDIDSRLRFEKVFDFLKVKRNKIIHDLKIDDLYIYSIDPSIDPSRHYAWIRYGLHGRHLEIVKLLMEYGVNIHDHDSRDTQQDVIG